MALITYNDKSNYQSSSLANEYKVTANDMNQIKNAINNATTYSATETIIGTWVDRKPVYRKVVSSNGVNGNNVAIAHGITSLKRITYFNATASNDNGTSYPMNNTSYPLEVVSIDSTNINMNISTGFGYGWTIYYILEYTKTTD